MNKQAGFTLIELVMVIVIIGILAAMAVPKFYNASGSAVGAARLGTVDAVRAAHSLAIAELRRSPTVTELAARVTSNGADAVANALGVQVTINGTTYTTLTFTDPNCTSATAAVGNSVGCVGNITP